MTHHATITYSREIIRKAVKRFCWRFVSWHGFAMLGLCLLSFAVLLVVGDRSWVVGVLGALSGLGIVMVASIYIAYLRRSLWRFERMSSKTVAFTFTEEGFHSQSDLGASEVSWTAVEKIWRFRDVWLLFVARAGYVTLPIEQLDQGIRSFIEEQVRMRGGQIA